MAQKTRVLRGVPMSGVRESDSLCNLYVTCSPKSAHNQVRNCILEVRSGYAEEQAHGSADDLCDQADGSGPQGRGCGPRGWGQHAHDLCLEGEVWWHGCERGAGGQAIARRELAAAQTGC